MIVVDITKCAGCGVCEQSCPTGAIRVVGDRATVNPSLCNDCGVCVEACPAGALSLAAEPVAAKPVVTMTPETAEETRATEVIRARPVPALASRSSEVLPLVGAALAFVGRSLAPRLLSLLAERGHRRRFRRRGRW